MFCPKCGEKRLTDETRYCSKCGMHLSVIEPFLSITPRKKRKVRSKLRSGLLQSYMIFAAMVLCFLLGQVLFSWLGINPRWFIISSLLLLVAGIFRIAYALLFESELLGSHDEDDAGRFIDTAPEPVQIAGSSFTDARESFGEGSKPTADLATPRSVTDSTTRSLKRGDQ